MSTLFETQFSNSPIMAILRGYGPAASLEFAERLWAAGVEAIEVPIQSIADVQSLTLLSGLAKERGLVVGAGTVTSPAKVEVAARAGAAYTVSPGLSAAVVRESLAADLPTLPGVATASEIQIACDLGLDWLKAFPAAALGTTWFRAMRGPFPDINLVATGGLEIDDVAKYLGAGAAAVSLGESLRRASSIEMLNRGGYDRGRDSSATD